MVRSSLALIAFAGAPLAACMRISEEHDNLDTEWDGNTHGMGKMGMGMGMGMGKGSKGPDYETGKWDAHYDGGTPLRNMMNAPSPTKFAKKLKDLDINAVKEDIKAVMLSNNENWPADYGNYGPLFGRLAWHCSGSYRRSDGKGGCAGGRQRFEPERSWDDNANLDKARALLTPIKNKYGHALSWGDLIVAAGTTSMREMGAPLTQLCFGRHDEPDGSNSDALGISGQPQSADPPCAVQGMCEEPLGTGTVGLIYVNPEGPVQRAGGPPVPDPVASAADIRDVFGRMDQDDRATVALIGGGHAFGKVHGACSVAGAGGVSPSEAYEQGQHFAWKGLCGQGRLQGKGPNTFTSGLEGPWTTEPTQWDNEFFRWMLDREWELHTGPGGKHQWRAVNVPESQSHVIRLTSDLALINDDSYLALVTEFANDQSALDAAFDDAWFKLTHRGGSWSADSKCDFGEVPAWVLEQGNNIMSGSDF